MSPQQPKGFTFIAAYDGDCWACGGRVYEGESATYNKYDELVHEECAVWQKDPTAAVCPACNMTLPVTGVCGVC